jgi:hypothetical protein
MSKNYNQVKREIKKLNKKEELDTNVIIQKGNEFLVYSEYKIVKDKHQFKIYEMDSGEFINTVFNSSTAISWCNAHKGNNVVLAHNIITTDRALEFLANDIAYTKMLIKLKDTPHNKQSILFARLSEYVDKQIRLKLNLHKYIQRSKQIKDKGFSNEFTATSKTKEFNGVR